MTFLFFAFYAKCGIQSGKPDSSIDLFLKPSFIKFIYENNDWQLFIVAIFLTEFVSKSQYF